VLTSLPLPALAALVIGGAIVFAAAGVMVVDNLISRRLEGSSAYAPIFSAAATMFAVFTAFLVVIVYQRYAGAQENVRDESSQIALMYRQTVDMPTAEQTQMRSLLRQYTDMVINQEFVTQERGKTSHQARKEYDDMYRTYNNLKPAVRASPINQQFMSQLSLMGSDRNKRQLSSAEALPSIMWAGLVLGGLTIISMSFLLDIQPVGAHIFLSSALAGLIGLLLCVALVLNHPFRGQLPIHATAFQHSLGVFDSVDNGG
jgi:hypothetical protein